VEEERAAPVSRASPDASRTTVAVTSRVRGERTSAESFGRRFTVAVSPGASRGTPVEKGSTRKRQAEPSLKSSESRAFSTAVLPLLVTVTIPRAGRG
jgi:hypothetical protein